MLCLFCLVLFSLLPLLFLDILFLSPFFLMCFLCSEFDSSLVRSSWWSNSAVYCIYFFPLWWFICPWVFSLDGELMFTVDSWRLDLGWVPLETLVFSSPGCSEVPPSWHSSTTFSSGAFPDHMGSAI